MPEGEIKGEGDVSAVQQGTTVVPAPEGPGLGQPPAAPSAPSARLCIFHLQGSCTLTQVRLHRTLMTPNRTC